jgi:hypothetical protein
MAEEGKPRRVDPYRYSERAGAPFRGFYDILVENWRRTSPLSALEFAKASFWLSFPMWLCAIPWIGLLAIGPNIAWNRKVARRRLDSGEVKAWAYRVYAIGDASFSCALQAIALVFVYQDVVPAMVLPVFIWVIVSGQAMGIGWSYLFDKAGFFRMSGPADEPFFGLRTFIDWIKGR